MKNSKHGFYSGRRSSGYGQRQIIDEEYHHACSLFGKTTIDNHLEAIKEGRTKVSLRELINKKLKK